MKESIFTIARMNPPTIGHLNLLKTMMDYAITIGNSTIHIILSSTKDKKNPLDCSRKKELLEAKGMINKLKEDSKYKSISVKIYCMNEPVKDCGNHVILKHVCNIRKQESPDKFVLFIGTDRLGNYKFIGTSLSKGQKTIGFEEIEVPRANDDEGLKADNISNVSMVNSIQEYHVSASLLRELVVKDKKDIFVGLVMRSGLSESDSNDLFNELRVLLSTPVRKTTASKKPRKSVKHQAPSNSSSNSNSNSNKKSKTNKKLKSTKRETNTSLRRTTRSRKTRNTSKSPSNSNN